MTVGMTLLSVQLLLQVIAALPPEPCHGAPP